jgi:hypothetical protein
MESAMFEHVENSPTEILINIFGFLAADCLNNISDEDMETIVEFGADEHTVPDTLMKEIIRRYGRSSGVPENPVLLVSSAGEYPDRAKHLKIRDTIDRVIRDPDVDIIRLGGLGHLDIPFMKYDVQKTHTENGEAHNKKAREYLRIVYEIFFGESLPVWPKQTR